MNIILLSFSIFISMFIACDCDIKNSSYKKAIQSSSSDAPEFFLKDSLSVTEIELLKKQIQPDNFKELILDNEEFLQILENQLNTNKYKKTNKINELTKKLAISDEFSPDQKFLLRNKEFYLSKCVKNDDNERQYAMLYSKYNEIWVPRIIYRSKSNGTWRSTIGSTNGTYEKGLHYTQDSNLDEKIIFLLNQLKDCHEIKKDPVKEYFNLSNMHSSYIKEFSPTNELINIPNSKEDEAEFVRALDLFEQGKGFHKDKIVSSGNVSNINDEIIHKQRARFFNGMNAKNLPHGFYPNFNNGYLRSYTTSHELISDTKEDLKELKNDIIVDVFLAKLAERPIEWHFAYQKNSKQPWISKIRFADSEINTYGGDSEIINSLSITLKPLEYYSQLYSSVYIGMIKENEDFTDSKVIKYKDIRLFLQNFPPIKDYKAWKEFKNNW